MAGITDAAAMQFATAMATEQRLEGEDRELQRELVRARAELAERRRLSLAAGQREEEAARDAAALVGALQRVHGHIDHHWAQLLLLTERRKNIAARARATQAEAAGEEEAVWAAEAALLTTTRDADVAGRADETTRRRAQALREQRGEAQRSLAGLRSAARRVDAATGKAEAASALVQCILAEATDSPADTPATE